MCQVPHQPTYRLAASTALTATEPAANDFGGHRLRRAAHVTRVWGVARAGHTAQHDPRGVDLRASAAPSQ